MILKFQDNFPFVTCNQRKVISVHPCEVCKLKQSLTTEAYFKKRMTIHIYRFNLITSSMFFITVPICSFLWM